MANLSDALQRTGQIIEEQYAQTGLNVTPGSTPPEILKGHKERFGEVYSTFFASVRPVEVKDKLKWS